MGEQPLDGSGRARDRVLARARRQVGRAYWELPTQDEVLERSRRAQRVGGARRELDAATALLRTHDPDEDGSPRMTDRPSIGPHEAVTGVLSVGFFALFSVCVAFALGWADAPPRLADEPPTAQAAAATETTAAGVTGTVQLVAGSATTEPEEPPGTTLPEAASAPQARGAYDPSSRVLALLAIVSPLLTTVVGYFFGQRTGAALAEAERGTTDARLAQTGEELGRLLEKVVPDRDERDDILDRVRFAGRRTS